MLRQRPSFTIVAALTLALGIGASTAIFSIVNVVILNPFPYPDADRLVLVRQQLPQIGASDQLRSSGPEFVDLVQSGIFERVAAYEPVSRNLTGSEEPERVAATKVSADFFPMLGIEPLLGRTLIAEEQGPTGPRVLVISHSLWQRRFGGNQNVVGLKVALDDEPFTIVGVMPPKFRYDGSEAWFPFPFDFNQAPRSGRTFPILARTKPGGMNQTKAQLEALARRDEQAYGGTNPEYRGRSLYVQPISEFYFGIVRRALFILLAAVGLVLLIACANIANLLLARSVGRSQEMAIRLAMGANRRRIIRQLLTESAVLALIGGGLGLLLATWAIQGLVALAPTGTVPSGVEVHMDNRVLLFALATSLLTALIFGLWPALQISRPQVQQALSAGSKRTTATGGQRRAQNFLVVAEVGLSLLLLVMAGLMLRSFLKLTSIDSGMDTSNVLSMRLNRSPAKSKDGQQNAMFFQQTIDRVKAVPGVVDVAAASHMPFVFTEDWTVTVESRAMPEDKQTQNIDTRTVSADYFSVMGIPRVTGEFFSGQDGPDSSPVIIVNEAMTRRFWPGEDAIGKRIKLGKADSKSPWFTIKGVVKDSAQQALDTGVKPEAYFALGQMAGRYRRMNLAVRTSVDPKTLVPAIQRAIHEIDSGQPVYQVQTMKELVGDSLGTRRFALFILLLFAALALVLAATGIYGVISYSVAQRTHEMGIRVALGAQAADVFKLVVGEYMRLTAAGVVIGLIGAFALTRLMNSLLFGVTSTDALTLATVSAGLITVALLACYVPARRATKVDPVISLRYE
jgi:putative ABC transport system permease protein